MNNAPLPSNEELRLQDLYAYHILGTDAEKDFDDLLDVVAQIYGCPYAALSFVDKDRQWLKAFKGLDPHLWETSRDISFCAHTILQDDVLVVSDARADRRFAANPIVTGGLAVRFYAGAPIVSGRGYNLGALCVIDKEPRVLTPEQTKVLRVISVQISKLLELRLKNRLLKQKAKEQLTLEKRLLQKALQEHEDEKYSIGTELHENIAQGLAATKFYLEIAEQAGEAKDELIRKCKMNVEGLIHQVRDLSRSIIPSTLAQFNLKDFLETLRSQFIRQYYIEARLYYQGYEELSADTGIMLYRIIEEQLKNIIQHSQATAVVIHLNVQDTIHLSIEDNGVGIDESSFKKGVGINKVLSMLAQFNGQLHVSRGKENGCLFTVSIPTHGGALAAEPVA